MQRAGDAGALERLRVGVLLADRHEPRHLVLGELDLLAAELGEREVGDLEVGRAGRGGGRHAVSVSVVGEGCGEAEQAHVLLLLVRSQSAELVSAGRVGVGVEPGAHRAGEVVVEAQAPREADLAEGDVVLGEQLAQRAQPLELGGAVEAVAGRPSAGGTTSPMRSM